MCCLERMSSVRESICRAAQELGYPVLKPEQLDVLVNFVKGRDVFAVLPTGFGKSLCYACLPRAWDEVLNKERGYCIVVLTASMSSSDEGETDRILGGADFEELETMNVSQPEGSQEILGVVPALTNDVAHTAGLAPRDEGSGDLQGGGPCQRPSLSLSPVVSTYLYKHHTYWISTV